MVKEGLIDIRFPALLASASIIWLWERYGEGIKTMRVELNFPRAAVEVEYLYDRVVEYGRNHPELGIASTSMFGKK